MASKLKIKPKIFESKTGEKGVVITFKEFKSLMEELENLNDLCEGYKILKNITRTIPYEKIRLETFDNAKK